MKLFFNHPSGRHSVPDYPSPSIEQQQQQYVKGCWITSHGRLTFWQCSHCGFIIDSAESIVSCPACITRPLYEVTGNIEP